MKDHEIRIENRETAARNGHGTRYIPHVFEVVTDDSDRCCSRDTRSVGANFDTSLKLNTCLYHRAVEQRDATDDVGSCEQTTDRRTIFRRAINQSVRQSAGSQPRQC